MSTSFQLQRILNSLAHLRANQNFIIDTILNDDRTYRRLRRPNNTTTTENIEISFTEPRSSDLLSSLFGGVFQPEPTSTLSLRSINTNTEVTTYTSSESNDQQMCPVCRVNFEENDVVRKINHCGHMYHLNCIDNWFQEHATCPVCRHNLNSNTQSNTTAGAAAAGTANVNIPTNNTYTFNSTSLGSNNNISRGYDV